MATRVHLADDHTMFREGLGAILSSQEGMEVVGSTSTGEEAAAQVGKTKPDVIVTQLDMQPKTAEEIVSGLRKASPDSRIVVLTLWDNLRYVQAVSKMAIDALMHKSSSAEELIATLGAVSRDPGGGNAVISMPRALLQRLSDDPAGGLSERELEVLVLAARGLSNRLIAEELHLADRGDRQAPPGQRLPEGGRALEERRGEDGAYGAVDRAPRDNLRSRRRPRRILQRTGALGSQRGLFIVRPRRGVPRSTHRAPVDGMLRGVRAENECKEKEVRHGSPRSSYGEPGLGGGPNSLHQASAANRWRVV